MLKKIGHKVLEFVSFKETLEEKSQDSIHYKTVNKAVSFNAIKNYEFEIFYESGDLAEKIGKLTQLFLMNPAFSACCPPSTSIIIFFSKHIKATKYVYSRHKSK